MHAVLETGGKQYRVKPGDILQVEKLEGEVGSTVQFDQILFVSKEGEPDPQIWLGKPYIAGANVEAEVVGQGRGEKILIIKMKRRKQYRRTQGHRQFQTQLLVTALKNGAGEAACLTAEDKKLRMSQFQTNLTPVGGKLRKKTEKVT
jgi:large subunit ribosomal protein L21